MKTTALLLTVALVSSGCMTQATISIKDASVISPNTATALFYSEVPDKLRLYVDGKQVGTLLPDTPTKIEVLPGNRTVHADVMVRLPFFVRREVKHNFTAGQTHFMRVWFDGGYWVSSIRVTPTLPVTEYTSFTSSNKGEEE